MFLYTVIRPFKRCCKLSFTFYTFFFVFYFFFSYYENRVQKPLLLLFSKWICVSFGISWAQCFCNFLRDLCKCVCVFMLHFMQNYKCLHVRYMLVSLILFATAWLWFLFFSLSLSHVQHNIRNVSVYCWHTSQAFTRIIHIVNFIRGAPDSQTHNLLLYLWHSHTYTHTMMLQF